MPTALRSGPYRFYFYSYDCAEPRTVHVDRDSSSAKLWLDPVFLAENYGHNRRELRSIERLTNENLEHLKDEWDDFRGSGSD
jgi:hypothetical protein